MSEILLRRDTKANLIANPPVIGEMVYAFDTNQYGWLHSVVGLRWSTEQGKTVINSEPYNLSESELGTNYEGKIVFQNKLKTTELEDKAVYELADANALYPNSYGIKFMGFSHGAYNGQAENVGSFIGPKGASPVWELLGYLREQDAEDQTTASSDMQEYTENYVNKYYKEVLYFTPIGNARRNGVHTIEGIEVVLDDSNWVVDSQGQGAYFMGVNPADGIDDGPSSIANTLSARQAILEAMSSDLNVEYIWHHEKEIPFTEWIYLKGDWVIKSDKLEGSANVDISRMIDGTLVFDL